MSTISYFCQVDVLVIGRSCMLSKASCFDSLRTHSKTGPVLRVISLYEAPKRTLFPVWGALRHPNPSLVPAHPQTDVPARPTRRHAVGGTADHGRVPAVLPKAHIQPNITRRRSRRRCLRTVSSMRQRKQIPAAENMCDLPEKRVRPPWRNQDLQHR